MIEYKLIITEPSPGLIEIQRRPVRAVGTTEFERRVAEGIETVLNLFNQSLAAGATKAQIVEGKEGDVGPIIDGITGTGTKGINGHRRLRS